MPKTLAAVVLVLCFPAVWYGAGGLHGRSSWIKLSAPNFDLYTTGDEDTGRDLILRLEWLRTLLQPILGWRGENRGEARGEPRDERLKPICIIAFGTSDEFQAYAPISRSIGFFLHGARRDFVVLDGTRTDSRAAAHEYVHFVMSQSGWQLPTWLNEGLAELYSSLEEPRSGNRTEIGRFIPGRVLTLRRDAWIGLEYLTSAGPDAAIFMDADSVDSAYAESWLLAHMLVLDPRYEAKFADLLAAVQTLETAEAFRQVYFKSIADVERDLKAYLVVGQTNARILGDPPAHADFVVTVEREADFDGLAALAEMLGSYRGRTQQSHELYRQLERDYPQRVP